MSRIIDIALDRLIRAEELRHDLEAYTRKPFDDAELALVDAQFEFDLDETTWIMTRCTAERASEPAPCRGEVWFAEIPGDKRRPVLVLTRDPFGQFLHSVICAPITSAVRGLATEVRLGDEAGILQSYSTMPHWNTEAPRLLGALLKLEACSSPTPRGTRLRRCLLRPRPSPLPHQCRHRP